MHFSQSSNNCKKAVLATVNAMIGRMNEVDDSAEESSKRMTEEVGTIENYICAINET